MEIKACSFYNLAYVNKFKANCKNDQRVVFKIQYGVCKIELFATPKIELLISINLLLCTSSRVLAVVQIMWEKSKERYMNDVLNMHGMIKTVF